MAVTELTTARLHLRPPTIADLDALYRLTESPTMRRYLGADVPSRADSHARMLRNIGSWHAYGYGSHIVIDRATDTIIGNCGIFHSYRGLGEDFDDRAEAGWIIAEDQWGKGYAREATSAALDWFDAAHGPREIVAMIEVGNAASERLAGELRFAFTRAAELGRAPMRLYRRG
jgi:RimJ/RimL family protein N-acetyltransferase